MKNPSVSLACVIGVLPIFPLTVVAKDGPGYGPGHGRDDSRYLYAVTSETAARCAVLQNEFSARQREANPEWSRRHTAMSLTWQQLVRELAPDDTALIAKATARDPKLTAELDKHDDPLMLLAERSRICEVTATVNSLSYNGATFVIEEQNPEIFADFAAKANQSGLEEFPEPPTKSIKFGDWLFEAKGNSCSATRTMRDGAVLTLGFTNFFDGSLKFEWDGLPELDGQSEEGEEEYEAMMRRHMAGYASDNDFGPVIAEGFTFATYPGTALFVDDKLIARPFGEGMSDGRKYYFGAYTQANYYNMIPTGKEVVVKVLGEETHRVRIDDPAMWNEMSNCMAQYPYG
ncbi:hypothetical protein QWY75_12700 [Pontixanthobacter aestiaquae]|uniref:Uncharacterized protein n=1 Tax=Pontixanthobacter aestiaquae TaxID=1509367 RepID=A0A844Z2P8_9SPHN|nr:hypothetical protein [Pontixanthobacter aestiaquae]MDN3647064.1 hypothetical protein [Pontixanthobacter aestiaquae]MXO81958.1 hypothetical protein [Pontixanthobacter aestiaquae]